MSENKKGLGLGKSLVLAGIGALVIGGIANKLMKPKMIETDYNEYEEVEDCKSEEECEDDYEE